VQGARTVGRASGSTSARRGSCSDHAGIVQKCQQAASTASSSNATGTRTGRVPADRQRPAVTTRRSPTSPPVG
jgi:hypothetical protein